MKKEFVEASHEFASRCLAVHLSKRMQKTIIRVRSYLTLVNKTLKKLVVYKNNLELLFISFHIVY